MAGGRDLSGLASEILASFAARLEELGADLPDRQYVAPGNLIAWDGEQLVVNLQSIDQGMPGVPVGTGYFTPAEIQLTATFTVTLIRSVVALEQQNPLAQMIPGSVQIGNDGAESMNDASLLVQAAVAAWTNQDFTNGGGGTFVIGPNNTVGPEGGLSGNRLTITIALL